LCLAEYDAAQARGEVAGHGGEGRKNQLINVEDSSVDLSDPFREDECFQCDACGDMLATNGAGV